MCVQSSFYHSSKRQTVFFLPVDPRDKSHKDPDKIDMNVTNGQRNWVRKMFDNQKGKLTVPQPEGEVVRQTKFFQSTQPTPNPIRDRSGRPDNIKMEETRPVLKRSMLILLTKNSVLQIAQGDLLKQRKFKHVHLKRARVSMLSRLMTEQGDLLLIQLQYKTTLKYVMKPIRSTLMMQYFVKEWRNPLLFMTRIMNR